NPWIVDDAKNWIMDRLTGGAWYEYDRGYDYSSQSSPGMGQSYSPYVQGYTPEGYYNEQGELIPYAEGERQPVGRDETGG
ncbi:MAG: hypothetical protein IJ048_03820, partial [Clostridia bacterium]|nr:hypothetical protein [Clostridia bacterium]